MSRELLLYRAKETAFVVVAICGWFFYVWVAAILAIVLGMLIAFKNAVLRNFFRWLDEYLDAVLFAQLCLFVKQRVIPLTLDFMGLRPPAELHYLKFDRLPGYLIRGIIRLAKPNRFTFVMGCLLPFFLAGRWALHQAVLLHHAQDAHSPISPVPTLPSVSYPED